MSLLRSPPHVVEVQRMKRVQDGRGQFHDVPDGGRIPVPCSVQSARDRSASGETLIGGLQVHDFARVFARTWPGDARALAYFDGAEWETVGSPQRFAMSPRTEHWDITLRRRGADG